MTVGNPEGFKIKLSVGREDIQKRIPCDFSNLTLKKLFEWIDAQAVSSVIKAELKKSASRFPHQTLGNWKNNYITHLSKAQSKVRKAPKNVPQIVEDEIVEKIVDEIVEDEIVNEIKESNHTLDRLPEVEEFQ